VARYKEDPQAEVRITDLCGQTLADLLRDIAADAKRYVPVDTGNLRSKIDSDKLSPTHGRVFANETYAAAVEAGYTHRSGRSIPAQPYLRPAAFKHRGGGG
jgi:hypothetical protein